MMTPHHYKAFATGKEGRCATDAIERLLAELWNCAPHAYAPFQWGDC